MERSLKAFLNPIKVENAFVEVSNRFLDEDGKPIKWEIRAISSEENDRLTRKHTKRDRKTKQEIFDRSSYINELVASAVVYPDLKNAELQKAYGVLGEVELLQKLLTVMGEFLTLSEEVQKLSGLFLGEEEDVVTEIKN